MGLTGASGGAGLATVTLQTETTTTMINGYMSCAVGHPLMHAHRAGTIISQWISVHPISVRL